MAKKVGKYTIEFENKPSIQGFASVCGKKESEGPLGDKFDEIYKDTTLGEKTWEKSESRMQLNAVELALKKTNVSSSDIDYIIAGDLLNQCISSTFGLRSLEIPYLGIFGACSTMAQSLALSSVMVDSGIANRCASVTSSHYCTAERQFRFPIEYGGQRTPTAQWTATGSGAVIVGKEGKDSYVYRATVGKIVDLKIKDINNMGAAMAPAAADTLKNYFDDTNTKPNDYDLILTGDLGVVGSKLLIDILNKENINISNNHNDCGVLLFDNAKQDTHAGGSGCGCSAIVLCSTILDGLNKGTYKNILFIATGALMSPVSSQQGESIPSIAHLINLKSRVI